jgi:hypothetical protein
MSLLGSLVDVAVLAGRPALSRPAFVSGAPRAELSVALGHSNAPLCRSSYSVATLTCGRTPMRGLSRLLAEVAWCCLLWVLVPVSVWSLSLQCWFRAGVRAGFMLGCVALTSCGIPSVLRGLTSCGFCLTSSLVP